MDSRSYTIGVLGGMGTYATIHIFRQYAEVFPAEKEWERPRIIIDNRCTMPSRVRAALYGENREQLISEMSDSVRGLVKSGCSRILLDCNTAQSLTLLKSVRTVCVQMMKGTCFFSLPRERSIPESIRTSAARAESGARCRKKRNIRIFGIA